MATPISPVALANPAALIHAITPSPGPAESSGNLFQSMFQTAVNTVQGTQTQANQAIQDFLSGNNEDVHTTVIATQRADLTFEMFMQVRNKVISAYQEIMRMQV
jgi:flagellar hook-basal body complex protein FliE